MRRESQKDYDEKRKKKSASGIFICIEFPLGEKMKPSYIITSKMTAMSMSKRCTILECKGESGKSL